MPKSAKATVNPGDVIAIPQNDKGVTFAQIVEMPGRRMMSCIIFGGRAKTPVLPREFDFSDANAIAAVWTTTVSVENGIWNIAGSAPIEVSRSLWANERTRHNGWVGARSMDNGIVHDFLNAYYGLSFWDALFDPNLFDSMLVSPGKKPKRVRLRGERGSGAEL